MATVEVRDTQGSVLRERELPAELFDAQINVSVMHQVVVAGAAAQRAGTHSTKTRGEVSGGGRKPWRQKGTGRARQGSIRSPQWVGGGVAHGPKPRDYSVRVNKRVKRSALRSALTDTVRSGKLVVVSGLAFDGPRSKDAAAVLSALELAGRVLLVLPAPDQTIEKSFRNLPQVKIAYPGNLGTWELLYADRVVFTAEALDRLTGEVTEPEPEAAEDEEPLAAEEPQAADAVDTSDEPEEEADGAEEEEEGAE